MKKLTIIFASLLLFSLNGRGQSGNWLSFVVQADARPGGGSSWQQAQRLEVSKRVGTAFAGQNATAGVIRLAPGDKEVRFTFSNFTVNGAWFSPSEVAIEYQEDGRTIGPVRALPGAGSSDYFQMTLRFREKTSRSLLSIRLTGRASSQFVKDTISTLLVWGGSDAETGDLQVSYLGADNRDVSARSPYAVAPASYGVNQSRITTAAGAFAIQLGAYSVIPDIRQFSAAAAYGQVYSRRIGGLNYVRVGPYQDANLAQQYLGRIRASFPEAYVVLEEEAAPAPAAGTYSAFSQPSQYSDAVSPRLPATTAVKGALESSRLPAGISGYAIQLASYSKEENAAAFAGRLKERGVSDVYVWVKGENNRVVIAPFSSKSSASGYLATLKSQYGQDGIVTYID
ncbi:MAG: SPOR domain-containing protein [Phaeodactylibacter sp.]|nr:SPOR domain-containing protein [Phaeodactylibacter sp.]